MKLDYFELMSNLAKLWDDNHAKLSKMKNTSDINDMLNFLKGITACMQVINKMESKENETK